jgi:hypothetical protein
VIGLFLRSRIRRIGALTAFALLFLLSGLAARTLVSTEHGQVEMGNLYLIGGYPLVSALLLLGWLIGRYALIAILVMMTGIVSSDRRDGTMRLYAARPVSLARIYLIRFAVAAGVALVLSGILMPAFDFLLLAKWGGPSTFVLIISYILVYGSLTFLLSVWTRGDVWIAMMLAILAMLWDAVLRSGKLGNSIPGIREVITILLPPQSALFRIETAFGMGVSIPWDSFAFIAAYAAILIVAALVSLRVREL